MKQDVLAVFITCRSGDRDQQNEKLFVAFCKIIETEWLESLRPHFQKWESILTNEKSQHQRPEIFHFEFIHENFN